MTAGEIMTKLQTMLPQNSKVPPEQQAELAKRLEGWIGENADRLQGAQDFVSGNKNTPQAQAFATQFQQTRDEFVSSRTRQLAAADPAAASTPQGWAGMYRQVTDQWEQMPFEMKLVTGLGLGGGLLATASALFGEGGVGAGLLGLLGIGVGGLAGASSGLFGQDAANMVGDAAYNAGTFFGAMPEKADFSRLRGEGAVDRIGVGDNSSSNTRENVKTQLAELPKQVESLTKLMQAPLPEPAKLQLMRRLDPSITSIDDARQILQNGQEFLTQYNNPESALQQRLNRAKSYSEMTGLPGAVAERYARGIPGVVKDVKQYAGDTMRTVQDTAKSVGSWASANAENLLMRARNSQLPFMKKTNAAIQKWAFNAMDAKELHDIREERSRGVTRRPETALREHRLNLRKMTAQKPTTAPAKKCVAVVMKAARCWAGYEPVPGAKAYSRGSCRPVGSKKTQKEMKSGKKSKN